MFDLSKIEKPRLKRCLSLDNCREQWQCVHSFDNNNSSITGTTAYPKQESW